MENFKIPYLFFGIVIHAFLFMDHIKKKRSFELLMLLGTTISSNLFRIGFFIYGYTDTPIFGQNMGKWYVLNNVFISNYIIGIITCHFSYKTENFYGFWRWITLAVVTMTIQAYPYHKYVVLYLILFFSTIIFLRTFFYPRVDYGNKLKVMMFIVMFLLFVLFMYWPDDNSLMNNMTSSYSIVVGLYFLQISKNNFESKQK
jgi:hypothetical protein